MKSRIHIKNDNETLDIVVESTSSNTKDLASIVESVLLTSLSFFDFIYDLGAEFQAMPDVYYHKVEDHPDYRINIIVDFPSRVVDIIPSVCILTFMYNGLEREVVDFEISHADDKIRGMEIKKGDSFHATQFKNYKISKASNIKIKDR